MPNSNPRRQPSVAEEGLRNHVGAETYQKLTERFSLNEPVSTIARAVGVSRDTIYKWRSVWEQEKLAN